MTHTKRVKAVFFDSPELDAAGQMALDEALMDLPIAGRVVLRIYRWAGGRPLGHLGPPWAATFGYSQRYEDAVTEVKKSWPLSFPLIRRPTGGGIVFHDGELTFSIIFPWERISTPAWVYKDIHRAVHLGLKSRQLPSRLWSPPGCKSEAPASCFAAPSPMDLVHEDGTKFLGGALRRRAGVGLYQGSLRTEGFPKPHERLVEAVQEGVKLQWKAVVQEAAMTDEIKRRSDALRERYASQDWNKRR